MATATATRKKKPARKLRQKSLPKMGQPRNEKIERLAEKYVEARDARMRLTTEETKNADLLETAMKEAGLTTYEFDGRLVELRHLDKVRVRRKEPKEFIREAAAKQEADDGE